MSAAVSDTASKDETADQSGPTIERLLLSNGCEILDRKIVPDDEPAIQDFVREWSDKDADWIITTGGTGFGVRDRTPEVLRSPL